MGALSAIAQARVFSVRKKAILVVCTTSGDSKSPSDVKNNPHQYFDSVTLVAKAGRGGNGSIFLRPTNSSRRGKASK